MDFENYWKPTTHHGGCKVDVAPELDFLCSEKLYRESCVSLTSLAAVCGVCENDGWVRVATATSPPPHL